MSNVLNLKILNIIFALFVSALQLSAQAVDPQLTKKWFPGHYAKVNSGGAVGIDEWRIEPVKDNPYFVGYTMLIHWNSFEKEKDVYDFKVIYDAIRICERDKKKLMITFQDVVHSGGGNPYLPPYILSSPEFEGGYYSLVTDGDLGTGVLKSYPKMWVQPLRDRWNKYVTAVGKEFDNHPTLAAVTFSESSRAKPEPLLSQPGFSAAAMIEYFKQQNSAAAKAFPNTIVMQYVNYVRAGATEEMRDDMMKYIVETLNNGFGGPDIINFSKKAYVLKSTDFNDHYIKYNGIAPISVEAQRGAFMGGSAREVFDYGVKTVKLHFMPWATGSRDATTAYTIYDVIKVINDEKGKINSTPPLNIIKSTTGSFIEEKSGSSFIYPNPAENYVTLRVENNYKGNETYHLLDFTGKLIDSKKITSINTIIPIAHLGKGLYYVRIFGNSYPMEVFKFMKI